MTDATRLVHRLAGSPDIAAQSTAKRLENVAGVCAICGREEAVTADFDRALGKNFTDRSLLQAGTSRVCTACLWCCSGKPPLTLRMWTVVADGGTECFSSPKAFLRDTPGLHLVNRGCPAPLVDLLSDPPDRPWAVSVAVSGQKHVLPYTPVNRGRRWTVRMEDTDVAATSDEWTTVHQAALDLRRMGVPADAVREGRPANIKTTDDLRRWRDIDGQLTGWHRSPLLDLALWTITKETMK
ncbi:hypothetical protein [uncultured Cutibacterium sp.]|jgi:hypothetical protein|uniref:hypothetical protein n=1 Tax=uncultured Cutibacterium sp. TaxID=1912223 RepID=UPI002047C2C6|nr:hypothetical protein [uncultured Cutibacterium sp.]MDU1580841.1 hypothetical protein [Cutibacterium granulosum]DAT57873.1 MAG TPA: Cas system-associated protein [Caudoviricetes sp.]